MTAVRSFTHTNDSAGGSWPISKPAGVVSTDGLLLIVALHYLSSSAVTFTTPTGFTKFLDQDYGSSGTPSLAGRLLMFQKTAGGSEPATYTFSYALNGVTSQKSLAQLIAISGAPDMTTIAAAVVAGTTNTGSRTAPSVTSTVNDVILRVAAFEGGAGTDSVTWSGSGLTAVDANYAGGGGAQHLDTQSEVAAATTAGTRTATYSVAMYSAAATLAIPALIASPVNTVAPAVTGTAAIGQTLSTNNGTWTGNPASFTYQWQRDGVDIGGATASSYLLASGDAGHTIRCVVTASNAAGTTTANSNGVAIPAAPINTVAPVVTTDGTPQTTETITVGTGTWTGAGLVFTYQWFRGTSPITGETSPAYTLAITDEGANITCRVTATNGGGSATAASNVIVPAVTSPMSPASFLLYYSGGVGNTDPVQSIGGARGGTYPGGLSALVAAILGSLAHSGEVIYAAVYLRNTHTLSTAAAGALFIRQAFAATGLHVAVGVPAEGVNTSLPLLSNAQTAPTGVTFTTATSAGAGAAFGDLAPADYRGVWLKFTVDPSTPPVSQSDAIVSLTANVI